MWSLGVLLYEMVSSHIKPSYDPNDLEKQSPFTAQQINDKEHHCIGDGYSVHIHELLDALLKVNPEERSSS